MSDSIKRNSPLSALPFHPGTQLARDMDIQRTTLRVGRSASEEVERDTAVRKGRERLQVIGCAPTYKHGTDGVREILKNLATH